MPTRYSGNPTEGLSAAVADKAWFGPDGNLATRFVNLPTMLTDEELSMLAFLAEHAPLEGPVLDLGCFLGGSTVALASGAARSRRERRLHSFDLFELNEAMKHRYLYQRGLPFYPGIEGLELFRIVTAAYADRITAHAGNIMATLNRDWVRANDPALVFLDLCKTPEITDHVTRSLLGGLRPDTWIVQQDFIYEFTPWAIYPFWQLREFFQFVGATEHHSAIFRVVAQVPEDRLDGAMSVGATPKSLADAIVAARDWFTDPNQQDKLSRASKLVMQFPALRNEWRLMQEDRKLKGSADPLDAWRALSWKAAR